MIKVKLSALELYYQATLVRLPMLKKEMDTFLKTADHFENNELIQRIEPVLEQATMWLLKVDLLPADLADNPDIQQMIAKFSNMMRLSTVMMLAQQFEQALQQHQQKSVETEAEALFKQVSHYLNKTQHSMVTDQTQSTQILNTLEQAANLGHIQAAYALYECYANIIEIGEQDMDKAIFWLEKVANQGDARSVSVL